MFSPVSPWRNRDAISFMYLLYRLVDYSFLGDNPYNEGHMPRPKPAPESIELDLGRYELRRRGRKVRLEKKPMELLIFLVSRRDQLVSREDIVARLWRSDLFVDTERNVNNIVRKIRAAIGDDADNPRFLETVVGKGYRFIGNLRVIGARHESPAASRSSGNWITSERTERTSLAVLPLATDGEDFDDGGLCLGFADALISRIGNLQGVDVLPTSTVLTAPAQAQPADLAARLGVRFVVRGAIETSKGQFRVSVEMFDAHLHRSCFSRRFDIDVNSLPEVEDELAKEIADALNRRLAPAAPQSRSRHSKDPLAYAEFIRGYRLSAGGDLGILEEATQRLSNAVTRDPAFPLAHATLSLVCAMRHFEFDPARVWLEKAEFHCHRALELDANLPEAHVANAFLLWGPSKNFQHLEAIAELRKAISLQQNLPHAYNRLGTILAHIGLLDHAREMYERGSSFHPKKAVSHSIVQVHFWNLDYDLAQQQNDKWRAESPGQKYPLYFAPQLAMMRGEWTEAKTLLDEAQRVIPDEPLITSLLGLFYALTGNREAALRCVSQACASPKSFGHAHHTYYQVACTLAILGQSEPAFEWLERSVSTGFACWPFFRKDPCLHNLRSRPDFELLVSALQSKYPDNLGLL
jgi:DNA-binding winged helix-turn-helix (wHTH) protein/tetratricopeptide (TPR) repeat protein